jgi:hypothetical protein
MYNSHATVRSGSKGWSGGIESSISDEFAGEQNGMSFGAASGDLVNVEKLYVSSVVRVKDSDVLLHCRIFPEEHRVHFSATTIQEG